MSPAPTMQAQVDEYLATRRAMGFDLRIAGRQLQAFARFADRTGHPALTVALAVRWAQSARRGTRLTWARRLQILRPFMNYRTQFDPGVEVAPSNLFGSVSRRLVPHIYTGGGDRYPVHLCRACQGLRHVLVRHGHPRAPRAGGATLRARGRGR